MQTENQYIGDEKMIKMLEHYKCPTPLGVVKMRFAGAICSPNLELRPADVISSALAGRTVAAVGNQRRSRFVF